MKRNVAEIWKKFVPKCGRYGRRNFRDFSPQNLEIVATGIDGRCSGRNLESTLAEIIDIFYFLELGDFEVRFHYRL